MREGQRVAVVTGAASGIGEAVASALVQGGAHVVCADCAFARLTACARSQTFLHMDVTREADWLQVVQHAVEGFGRVDLLVNGAGAAHTGAIADIDLATWREGMAVNVEGAFLGIKHVAGVLRRNAAGGSIINIASVSPLRCVAQTTLYAASKAAVIALTRAAAVELAPLGVRVNCVSPGGVKTLAWTRQPWWAELVRREGNEHRAWQALAARTPSGRLAEPGEVAEAVTFLASNGALVGANIVVDGGYSV